MDVWKKRCDTKDNRMSVILHIISHGSSLLLFKMTMKKSWNESQWTYIVIYSVSNLISHNDSAVINTFVPCAVIEYSLYMVLSIVCYAVFAVEYTVTQSDFFDWIEFNITQ